MRKWPTSGWVHAGIALVFALILSGGVGCLAEKSALTYLMRTSPPYGDAKWHSFGAFVGGIAAAFWTYLIAFVFIFLIQRILASERETDSSSDEPPRDIR